MTLTSVKEKGVGCLTTCRVSLSYYRADDIAVDVLSFACAYTRSITKSLYYISSLTCKPNLHVYNRIQPTTPDFCRGSTKL